MFFACALAGFGGAAHAARAEEFAFDVPPQTLSTALLSFSEQVDRQIIVPSQLVESYRTDGVAGTMSLQSGLTQLLEGTGLSFEELGAHTLRIIRAPQVVRSETRKPGPPRTEFQNRTEEHDMYGFETIIVTARRTAEDVQDVPIAMNVFSDAVFKSQDVRTFNDLETLMPGVDTCCGRGNVSSFTFIRGINNTVGYFAEVPTLLNGSGLYFDLDNLEVLKGPQGTLFGIATNGGAILVEPARPTHRLEGYSSATFGDYDRETFEGVINLPLSDRFSVRLGLQRERRDGYVLDVSNDRELGNEDYWTARMSTLWDIADTLQNYEVWNYYVSDRVPEPLGIPYGPTAGIAPGGLFAQAFAGPALQAFIAQSLRLGPYAIVGTDVPGGSRDSVHQSNLTDVLTFTPNDHLKLKNIFGFYSNRENSIADTDGTPFPGYETGVQPSQFGGPTVQFSDEIQVQGTTGDQRLRYVIGSFNRWNNVDSPGLIYQDVLGVTSATRAVQSGRTHSLFAEGTYSLDPFVHGLAITAGYRQTWDERSASQLMLGGDGATLSNFDANASWAKGSYRVGLTYTPFDSTMFYFTNSKGYSAGGFNLTAPDTADQKFNPEILNNFEIGIKSEWKLGSVLGRTNFAAYYGLYENIQAQVTTRCQTPTGPIFCQITRNAAEGTIDGAESEFTLLPFDWLSIAGNVGFMEGRYSRYEGLDPTGTIPLDLSHTAFLYLPKWKYSVTSRVSLPTPDDLGKLSLSGSWSWTDKINCCFTVGPPEYYNTSPPVKNLNLTLTLADLGHVGGLSAAIIVTNVTGNEVMHGQWGVYEQIGQYARAVAVPRMWSLTLRYDF